MVNYPKKNIFLFFIIFLCLFNISHEKKRKPKKQIIKPRKYSFSPIDIDFRQVGTTQKISNKLLNRIKTYCNSVKRLIRALIYTNLAKKDIRLDKKILDNFEIKYDDEDEPLVSEPETLSKHLVVIYNFKKMRKKLFYSTLYKKDKSLMREPDSRQCFLALITINTLMFRHYIAWPTKFKMLLIKEIFYLLGFRRPIFQRREIRNNFNEVPYYLIKDLKSFNSYQKYLSLTDRKYEKVSFRENGNFYSSQWPSSYMLNDIMSKTIGVDTPVTELTANVFNDMNIFSINKCDLLKYKAGFGEGFSCVRPEQNCVDEKTLNKSYFLEYSINENTWKCYLNTKENIKNKQCGVLAGNLCNLKMEYRYCPSYIRIKPEIEKNKMPIPELDIYNSQKIKLLKRGPHCPNYFPRSVFFTVPESVFDEYKDKKNITELMEETNKINKDVKYDEIILDESNRKYFVTYEATEEYYARESVMKVMNNSGVIRSYSKYNSHNLLLKQPLQYVTYKKTPRFQKIFSFINFSILSHKDLTYKYYLEMQKDFPDEYDYIAKTYSYPEEKKEIEKMLKNYKVKSDDLWLIKPKSGSLGHGIRIFLTLKDIPREFLLTRYVNPPHLINNKKYDFRVYLLVTGIAPFRIYLYTEGLVRFASEEYSTNIKDLKQTYRHLTNISLNKKNKKSFVVADDADTEEGNRWSFKAYKEYCRRNNVDFDYIFEQIKDNSIKAFISVHKEYYDRIIKEKQQCHNFFELHGLDYLPDKDLKLYFLEGNDRPSLLMGDINDRKLKPQLVADVLNLVGIVPYSHEYDEDFKPYEDTKKKFPYYTNEKERIQHDVDDALCEFGRPRGRFQLIFPLKENIEKYKKMFRIKLPENELLWKYIQDH